MESHPGVLIRLQAIAMSQHIKLYPSGRTVAARMATPSLVALERRRILPNNCRTGAAAVVKSKVRVPAVRPGLCARHGALSADEAGNGAMA